MAGRRPKPDELKAAQGFPGKRRPAAGPETAAPSTESEAGTAGDPPVAADQIPAVDAEDLPAALVSNEIATAAWRAIVPQLSRLKLMRTTDREGMVRYCLRLADWYRVRAELDRPLEEGGGEVYETETRHGNMRRINPLFMVRERLEKGLIEYEDRFGLNPVARQRILQAMAASQPALPLDAPPAPAEGAGEPAAAQPSPVGALGNATRH